MKNYVAYALNDGTGRTRVGHLDHEHNTITPLAFKSGTAVSNVYQVIEVGDEEVVTSGAPVKVGIGYEDVYKTDASKADSTRISILPPLSDRDVLAVGKNYSEHAKEFNASGYDASDKVDMPTHPVIFTKRATSIVAQDEDILLHPGFTETLDYEGEIGVIIGKGGYRIAEAEAMSHVWGYTIINDVTAREKQRDHKQFYIGKSADSYCPMGPVAVPASTLPRGLQVTTRVNGEQRQQGSLDDLIFSIPFLVKTLSESQTLRAGDVIATGTPAGVGFGLKPPVFLKAGDVVEISVTGLGTLRNKVANPEASNYVTKRAEAVSTLPFDNLSITMGGLGLTTLPNGKKYNVNKFGSGEHPIVFVHGLGGTGQYWAPVLSSLGLDKEDNKQYTSVTYDLEGHGMTPTAATSVVTISSLAEDLKHLINSKDLGLQSEKYGIVLVAHSMGCLVAELFASRYPDLVKRLVLLGPPPLPLASAVAEGSIRRAATVRAEGMRNVAMAVAAAGTSPRTKTHRRVALTAVQMSLMSQDPEGYAKGCAALAGAKDLQVDFGTIKAQTLIVGGDDDRISPPAYVAKLAESIEGSSQVLLREVGHWHAFEDEEGVSRALGSFLHMTI